MAIRSVLVSSAAGRAGPGRRLGRVEPGRLEDRALGERRVARGAGDPAPVRVPAVDRGLDQRRRDHRPGDGARVGVVGGAGDLARDERRGALAVGGLLAREVARDGLDGGPERGPGRGVGRRVGRPGLARREQEHGVVGAGVAVDRELVPGVGPPRRAGARGASPGSAVASVRTTESIVAMLGWIIPTPLAIPVTVTVDRAAARRRRDRHRRRRHLGRRVGRAQRRRGGLERRVRRRQPAADDPRDRGSSPGPPAAGCR